MSYDINIYSDHEDVFDMDEEEFMLYGLKRMKTMIKLQKDAEQWFLVKNTPFQKKVLEMAEHHVSECEQIYGISRYDRRLREARAL